MTSPDVKRILLIHCETWHRLPNQKDGELHNECYVSMLPIGAALVELKRYERAFNKKYSNGKLEVRILTISDLGMCFYPELIAEGCQDLKAMLVEDLVVGLKND